MSDYDRIVGQAKMLGKKYNIETDGNLTIVTVIFNDITTIRYAFNDDKELVEATTI